MLHDGVGLFQHCAHPRQRLHQRRHLRLSRLLMGGGRAPFRPRCNHRGPPNAIAVGTAPSAIPAFVAMPRHDLTRCVPIPQTSVPCQIASVSRPFEPWPRSWHYVSPQHAPCSRPKAQSGRNLVAVPLASAPRSSSRRSFMPSIAPRSGFKVLSP